MSELTIAEVQDSTADNPSLSKHTFGQRKTRNTKCYPSKECYITNELINNVLKTYALYTPFGGASFLCAKIHSLALSEL